MQDTAETAPEAAGQPEAAPEDTTAVEQMLAEAVQTPEDPDPAPAAPEAGTEPAGGKQADPWADPDAARKEIEKLRKESAKWRTQYRDAEPKLTEYQKYLDSQKTEQQRLAEAKEAAERELSGLRSANARLMAAATHNLPPELIEDLGDGTEEEIDARAERLAALIKAAEARGAANAAADTPPTPSAPSAQRPVEALHAGAAPTSQKPQNPDDWLRSLRDASRG